MIRITSLVCSLLILISINTYAQSVDIESKLASDYSPLVELMDPLDKPIVSEVNGFPYLYEDYRVGFVFFQDSIYKFPLVKVNTYENQLELNYMGIQKKLAAEHIHNFQLLNPFTNEFENYYNTDDIKFKESKAMGFIRKIKIGEYILFVSHSTIINTPSENLQIMGTGPEPRYVHKTAYYSEKRNWLYIMKKKKDVIKNLMGKHRKAGQNYIKEQKLKFKKAEDYLLLYTYLADKDKLL